MILRLLSAHLIQLLPISEIAHDDTQMIGVLRSWRSCWFPHLESLRQIRNFSERFIPTISSRYIGRISWQPFALPVATFPLPPLHTAHFLAKWRWKAACSLFMWDLPHQIFAKERSLLERTASFATNFSAQVQKYERGPLGNDFGFTSMKMMLIRTAVKSEQTLFATLVGWDMLGKNLPLSRAVCSTMGSSASTSAIDATYSCVDIALPLITGTTNTSTVVHPCCKYLFSSYKKSLYRMCDEKQLRPCLFIKKQRMRIRIGTSPASCVLSSH